jgi:hypothetical protein
MDQIFNPAKNKFSKFSKLTLVKHYNSPRLILSKHAKMSANIPDIFANKLHQCTQVLKHAM